MDNSLKTKLLQLECQFTWDFKKEDTSIADLEERLHEEIQFSLRKYKGSSYNHLAYVKHLQGLNKEALTFLEQAEEITRKDHGDEFENLVIVTYGNFAWVYYHMGELTKAENYLEKLEDICKKFNNTASRYSVLLPAVYGEKGLSFLKHLQGVNEEALKYLQQAEEITWKDHEDEFEKLVIVTYGNFAWVHYHMGELNKAQSYLEKLEDICKRLPKDLPPAVYREKRWTFLRVWDKNCDKSKECFEKALELEPDEKEWNYGYANVLYCQRRAGTAEDSDALKQLRRAQKLDPENTVIMVLLGLKQ
ncbi:UNVERIFIED_CONTAM: hypothetical protein FKN15_013858 [Acipenser sinensis]